MDHTKSAVELWNIIKNGQNMRELFIYFLFVALCNLENKIRPITYILHGKSLAAFDLIEHLLSKQARVLFCFLC